MFTSFSLLGEAARGFGCCTKVDDSGWLLAGGGCDANVLCPFRAGIPVLVIVLVLVLVGVAVVVVVPLGRRYLEGDMFFSLSTGGSNTFRDASQEQVEAAARKRKQ